MKEHTHTPNGNNLEDKISLIPGHLPNPEQVQSKLGPYQILKSIGKGGMGEVYLAYDTRFGRRIALKRIRNDLINHKQLQRRFLKEARITCQLTHPAIIPIYTIDCKDNSVYYTMPYIEGKTLKKILHEARQQKEPETVANHVNSGSILSLMRIFITVCHAVAYAHAQGVLHRDLKPENVMIGQYGEVYILDWGLVKLIEERLEENSSDPKVTGGKGQQTLHGKIVGTVSHMAPERARGNPASFQTEVYALGVILYQILALHLPFKRKSLDIFQKTMDKEELISPDEMAPYRSVSKMLSTICLKCLAPDEKERYQTVEALVHDIENYLEGRSEWIQVATLDINDKSCWEFQENILIAEHIAITRQAEMSEWVSFMVSREAFHKNTKIEARIKIHKGGHGIGFLLSIPEASERMHIHNAYCLWLGSKSNKTTKLLRSNIEVLHHPDVYLTEDKWHAILLEKRENNIYFYLDNILQFSYISYLPLDGTHVGVLARDAHYTVEDLNVFIAGQNIHINCLAVPDAFLAHKDYAKALSEYRRIAYSFPGRDEGREALFFAGITLLEHAKAEETDDENLYNMALIEFEQLHTTPGAPLEYLGKGLVYQSLNEDEEEVKCYELAFRRYPNHPLLSILEEQVLYRMHESSRFHRRATYRFLLLVLSHLPKLWQRTPTKKLITSLKKHWEKLPFIEEVKEEEKNTAVQLAFWLAKPLTLLEILDSCKEENKALITNLFYCLLELGAYRAVKRALATHSSEVMSLILEETSEEVLTTKLQTLPVQECNKAKTHLLKAALLEKNPQKALNLKAKNDSYTVMAHLFLNQNEEAKKLINKMAYPLNPFLKGCLIATDEGKEKALVYFSTQLTSNPFPPTSTLGIHWLKRTRTENKKWLKRAFLWEKRELWLQLSLFAHCLKRDKESTHYLELAKQEMIDVST